MSKPRIMLIFLAISFLVLPALADRTVLQPAFNLFTTQQDIEMGRDLTGQLESRAPLIDDQKVNTYIDALGRQLSSHAPGERYPYQFRVVDDDALGATALPGGFIYINRGSIEAADNEPQLAGLIAHEIAHVALRHGSEQVSRAYAAAVPNARQGRVSVMSAMDRLNVTADTGSVALKHSREAERQADLIATQIMYDAGFDPQQMIQFFQRLAGINRQPLHVRQRVAATGIAKIERAGVRQAGDVERTAMRNQRHRIHRFESRAVVIERLVWSRHV